MTTNRDPQAFASSSLCWAIAQRIHDAPDQRISFAEYMDLALYHPEWGYYASRRSPIGARGDFVTSPHMGADFGELLAKQFVDMWNRLGQPHPFHLVEMGAGQGLIVRDVLNYLHRYHFNCFEALKYLIVEKSAALIAEQKRQLSLLPSLAEAQTRLQWVQWQDIANASITGCFFSNELVDALPVHQVVVEAGSLKEIYVTLENLNAVSQAIDEGQDCTQDWANSGVMPRFAERVGELSTPELQDYFAQLQIDLSADAYPDGYRAEVNLNALDWIETVSQRLQRGYVLTIDYGYPAHRLYNPARAQGTLQCYYRHAHHSDPYIHVGRQDMTAHVDFTTLEQRGTQTGLQSLGMTPQAMFLMALGLGDRIAALSHVQVEASSAQAKIVTDSVADPSSPASGYESEPMSMNDVLRRREALHALMNPLGMGNFQVLLQAKGLSLDELARPLQGFDIPPLSALISP
ncbi:MAG: class I SAM-dependent methyltransferase [Elainellaceae cyanobacterium]